MQVRKNHYSFPILTERLPVRTAKEQSIEELEADLAVAVLEIDAKRSTFEIQHQEVLAQTPSDETNPRSMSKSRVAYLNDAHGYPTLYVRKVGKHAQPIAPSLKVTSHVVSPDGQRVFFSDSKGWVRQWDEDEGLSKPLYKAHRSSKLLGFQKDTGELLFTKNKTGRFKVLSYDFLEGETKLLFADLGSKESQFAATLTPSGRHLIVTRDNYITKVCLEDDEVEQDLLTHCPGYFDKVPRFLTALDDRFLLYGTENYVKVNDLDLEMLYTDDFDISDLTSNDDGEFYDEDGYPEAICFMDFEIYDTKLDRTIGGDWAPRVGGAFISGGNSSGQKPFDRKFAKTTSTEKECAAKIEEIESRPRRDVDRLSDTHLGW